MKVSIEKVRRICRKRGITLAQALNRAGVSRNAFYSLARKESVLPVSIRAIAGRLGVKAFEFLDDEDVLTSKTSVLMKKVDRIAAKYPGVDRDNVRHTFLLLEEEPAERLRRALIRGQKSDIH
ncbi:MAG: hypothetical protein A2283_16555 [Lentisphaerae bacterium RIFOXYA12_FULL_48_11]|nr:MAG: hypothetical protein A2283_16555 [Lentisphaerae bacterium RIFOXYA12_FULL_48_11]